MKGKRVIIVEGQLIVAEDLKNIVEEHGYKVEEIVTSLSEAAQKVSEIMPDVIVVDVPCDGGDPADMIATLARQKIGIIFTTVHLPSMFSGMDYRQAVVIEKPFSNQEVSSALRLLEKRMQTRAVL